MWNNPERDEMRGAVDTGGHRQELPKVANETKERVAGNMAKDAILIRFDGSSRKAAVKCRTPKFEYLGIGRVPSGVISLPGYPKPTQVLSLASSAHRHVRSYDLNVEKRASRDDPGAVDEQGNFLLSSL